MSDYGASITLTKKDKKPVTEIEKEFIKTELAKIKNGNEFSDVLGEGFLFEVSEVANENAMLHIIFSEYWHGDGDEEDNFEFAKENDFEQVEKIAEKLRLILSETFDIIPAFESW